PSALLPMDMPRDMQVVETQMEDVSHDFECYTDAEQHTYRFGYGMNFEGVIHDARVEKYAKK
ncbi:MAG: beta-glucosidase, partial [Muribaculaceae bacterium]|nr:beta-glucosidase [Muribaculaceae bacterium]